MNSNRGLLSLIVLLAVGVPVGTLIAGSGTQAKAVPSKERKREGAELGSKTKPLKGAQHESDVAAPPAVAVPPSKDDQAAQAALDGVILQGRHTAASPRFIFATLPDPIESPSARSFDESLAAVRSAFESLGFSKFESWDPWFPTDGKEVEGQPWRKYPGVVLFQNGNGEQWAVFLIGETPTRGVHNDALLWALDYWARTDSPDGEGGIIRILGPSNSGGSRSLANTAKKWIEDNRPGGVQLVRIVTGSATGTNNAEVFQSLERELSRDGGDPSSPEPRCKSAPPGIFFEATVNDDDSLQAFVADYLRDQLRIKPGETAILTESSSAYGQGFADGNGPGGEGRPLVLRYPPYINSVRREDGNQTPGTSPANGTLDGDGDDDRRADLFSPHAALSRTMADLSLARVIRAISEEHTRAVEIVALDPEDAAFLATKVREAFPAVVVVVLSSDELYLRPKYSLDGLLIASTYPLSLRSQRTAFAFTGIDARLSFPSEQAEGVFNATLVLMDQEDRLLDYGPPLRVQQDGPKPALWMSVVSNHELWPVEVRTREDVAHNPHLDLPCSHVHPGKLTPKVSATPLEAWRPSWAIGFDAFALGFAFLSFACAGYYVRARWLTPEPPPETAPLIVRIIGRRRDNETLRGLSVSLFLLVLSTLWSFVAIVDWGGGRRPPQSLAWFGLSDLVRPVTIVTLAIVVSLCCDALIVWASPLVRQLGARLGARVPERRRIVEPTPDAGDGQRSARTKASPWRQQLRKKWPRILLSVGVGLVIVGLNWVFVRHWIQKCGFGGELVDRAVDARCQRFILFFDRARFLGSGVSLLLTTIVLAVGYVVWYAAHLYKVWLTHSFEELRHRDMFPGKGDTARSALVCELGEAFTAFESVNPSVSLWIVMTVVFGIAFQRASAVPCFEKWQYRDLTALFFAVFLTLLVFGAGRSFELWGRLRQLLRHAATTRILGDCEKAPAELLGYLAWPWDPQVAQAWRAAGRDLSPAAGTAFAKIIGLDGTVSSDEWKSYLAPAGDVAKQEDDGQGRTLLRTLYLWSSITYLRMHLLGFLRATSVGLLVSLIVVSMYPFRGERLLLGMVIVLGTLTALTVTVIFLQLGKDYVVVRLGGKAKEASWDPEFIRGIILHAVLPLLGLLAVRFPGIGQTLGTVLSSLSGMAGKE